VWLTPISPNTLILVAQALDLGPIYLVQHPEGPLEYPLRLPTRRSKRTPIRRSSTRSPGVWVPPIGFSTPIGEHLFGSTQSELHGLWSEIMDTLVASAKLK